MVWTTSEILDRDSRDFLVLSNTLKRCSPECDLFRCGQRALTFQGQRAYCRWADDTCTGGTCNYAVCVKSKLLSNGLCGLSIKRRTSEDSGPELLEEPQIKLKGKIRRRFRSDELL